MNEVEALKHFDSYQGIICAIFSDGRPTIIYGNERFYSLFKNSRGSTFDKFIHPKDEHIWTDCFSKARSTPRKLFSGTVRTFCTGHVWELIAFELYYRDGKFGLVGYKIPAGTANLQKVDKYEENLREIAFIQSHEFRPPVARILGISDLAIQSNDVAELKNYAQLMRADAQQLDVFIKTIVSLTEIPPRDNESGE